MVPGLALGTAAFLAYTAVEFAVSAAFPAGDKGHDHHKH